MPLPPQDCPLGAFRKVFREEPYFRVLMKASASEMERFI